MTILPFAPAGVLNKTVSNISNGSYTIRVSKNTTGAADASFKNYDALCSLTLTYENTSNQALALSQSLFTSACNNSTATILAIAQGGGGKYTYSLYNGSGASAVQVGASQTSSLFNNLNPGLVYEIRVTDSCGNGTQISNSFTNLAPPLYTSSRTYPCPGQSYTLALSSYLGAAYTWQKNSAAIAGATANAYTISPVPASGSDVYRGVVTLGNCALFSKTFTLDPNKCGQPLPFTLKQFSAGWQQDGSALLSWMAANETNVDSYEISYSTDARTFISAGKMANTHAARYTFTDENRNQPVLYYKLAVHEQNGHITYSPVIKLMKHAGLQSAFSVYPTVVSKVVYVTYNAADEDVVNCTILNSNGVVIKKAAFTAAKGTNTYTLDLGSELPAGVYLMRLQGANGNPYAAKFIIDK